MDMDASSKSEMIVSTDSTATLDLQDLLSSLSGDNLLSTSLSLISASASSHSFDDVPPFPTTSRPSIFLPELGDSLLGPKSGSSSFPSDDPLRTTVPTGPRLKLMMLEPASVAGWIVSLPFVYIPSAQHITYNGFEGICTLDVETALLSRGRAHRYGISVVGC